MFEPQTSEHKLKASPLLPATFVMTFNIINKINNNKITKSKESKITHLKVLTFNFVKCYFFNLEVRKIAASNRGLGNA